MSIRSLMLASLMSVAAVGCVDAGNTADDSTGTTSQNTGGGFSCFNKLSIQVVSCVGSIAVLPINVDIHSIRALNANELNILSNDLNDLSILDGNILDYNTILNDVEVTTLNDFLTDFAINVTHNDINVCTLLLGIQLCK